MAATQEQLDDLTAAINSGLLSVRNGNKIVTYQSVDAMQAAKVALIAELASQAKPRRASPRYQLADFRDD